MAQRKTNLSLTGYAISRLGTGYIYGTYGHILTDALLAAKIRQYPTRILKYEEFIRKNWLNKPVQDCVGLIKGHYWTNDDGKIVYKLDDLPDVSAKVKNDPGFATKFTSNPVQAVESVLGVDLPDDQVKSVVDGVKAKVSLDNAGDVLGSIKKLF